MCGLPKRCLFLLLVAVTAFSYPRHKVTFTYEDESAKTVHLVGTMNGWDKTSTPFSKKDAKFGVTVELYPGEYEYKFLIDGEKWITDPNNELICPGKYKNSLLIVGSEEEIEEIKGELRERGQNSLRKLRNWLRARHHLDSQFLVTTGVILRCIKPCLRRFSHLRPTL